MGPATTPRHRADVSRARALADLRRRAALLVVGRDLYADDLVLRAEAPRAPETGDDSTAWAALRSGSAATRRTAHA